MKRDSIQNGSRVLIRDSRELDAALVKISATDIAEVILDKETLRSNMLELAS